MVELIVFLVMLAVGYSAGRYNETRHYKSIREREEATQALAVLNTKQYDTSREIEETRLVVGNVAVAIDYFKVVAGALRNFVGGRVVSYETLVDRARREAVLRMKDEARGFDLIINARLETASIGKEKGNRRTVHSIEAYAYGTAVRFKA